MNTLLWTGVIIRSGSTLLNLERMSESNPLYTDNIIISAAVPIAIPIALIAEIMLITLCDFFAKRYLPAMNGASFTSLLLQKFFDMLYIIKRTVEVEHDLRYNAKLLSDLASKLAAQCLCILLQS